MAVASIAVIKKVAAVIQVLEAVKPMDRQMKRIVDQLEE